MADTVGLCDYMEMQSKKRAVRVSNSTKPPQWAKGPVECDLMGAEKPDVESVVVFLDARQAILRLLERLDLWLRKILCKHAGEG